MHELDDMTAFLRVASTRSFARAAELLGTTPSAVSKAIARLEKRLDVKLFVRTTRSVRLSEAGATFSAHCQRILADLHQAESEVRADRQTPRGRLRLEVPLTLGAQVIVPALAEFTTAYQELELDVHLRDRYVDLVAEGVDAAIRVGPLDDSRLLARRLAPTRHVLVGSPAYLGAHGTPRSIDDLAQHAGIVFRSARTGRKGDWRFLRAAQQVVHTPRARVSFTNSYALLAAAAAGLGLAQVLDFAAALPISRGELVEVLADVSAPGPHVFLVTTREQSGLAKVRALSDFLSQHFAAAPPWAALMVPRPPPVDAAVAKSPRRARARK
jgi:DNA-binding transcriptional LysR family regulator